eukprot:CAMPEP_0180813358 /NCGR_PEP_ID=MMETSP1038_2-20121128/66496_1 /TAXON_ID=632150 /ORGANISM="Azadinium spinosum, Strain 3D9" /LENGTH=112 /DNA_ID=CAMNT_0022854951 /DNA_START=284 /DNA_END=621 /DNA_ORIENTATION=+
MPKTKKADKSATPTLVAKPLAGRPDLEAGQLLSALQKLGERGGKRDHPGQASVRDEEEKELVVAEADAITDPRAMVVHAQHAFLANAAMVRPLGAWTARLTPRGLTGLQLRD